MTLLVDYSIVIVFLIQFAEIKMMSEINNRQPLKNLQNCLGSKVRTVITVGEKHRQKPEMFVLRNKTTPNNTDAHQPNEAVSSMSKIVWASCCCFFLVVCLL